MLRKGRFQNQGLGAMINAGTYNRHRVVVTGLGALTCLGQTAEETWHNLLAGRSGIRRISSFPLTSFKITVAGEIQEFSAEDRLGADWAYLGDRFSQLGLAAACEAAANAGFDIDRGDLARAGIVMSNAHNNCGRNSWAQHSMNNIDIPNPDQCSGARFIEFLQERISAMCAPHPFESDVLYRQSSDYPTHLVALRVGTTGPLFTVSSACVSGAKTVERAVRWLRRGQCEIALAGGSESVVDEWGVWFLDAMRALTSFSADPRHASRPFDKDRSGFVLAEGAGVLVLETLEHARKRGADILAEVVGVGGSANANSLYAPEPVGDGVAGAMRAALHDGRVNPDQIDAIFAHATATGIGDPAEADGIRMTLGTHSEVVATTATKSMIGHAIAAAGAIGAVNCVQALRDQIMPPTINLDNPDECTRGLHVVTGQAEERPMTHVLNNAFGFGGANGSNIFMKFEG